MPQLIIDAKTSLDQLYAQYYSDIPEDDFFRVMLADPDYVHGSNQMGPLGKYLLDRYRKEPATFSGNGPEQWKQLLTRFKALASAGKIQRGYQINQLKSLAALASFIENLDPAALEARIDEYRKSRKQADPNGFEENKFYNWDHLLKTYPEIRSRLGDKAPPLDEGFSSADFRRALLQAEEAHAPGSQYEILDKSHGLLIDVKTKLADEVFGENSSWCTAWKAKSYWDQYSGGILLIWIPDVSSSLEDAQYSGEKYQFYTTAAGSSTQIRDIKDRIVSLEDLEHSMGPAYSTFEEYLDTVARLSTDDLHGRDFARYHGDSTGEDDDDEDNEDENDEAFQATVESNGGIVNITVTSSIAGEIASDEISSAWDNQHGTLGDLFTVAPITLFQHLDMSPFSIELYLDRPIDRDTFNALYGVSDDSISQDNFPDDFIWRDPLGYGPDLERAHGPIHVRLARKLLCKYLLGSDGIWYLYGSDTNPFNQELLFTWFSRPGFTNDDIVTLPNSEEVGLSDYMADFIGIDREAFSSDRSILDLPGVSVEAKTLPTTNILTDSGEHAYIDHYSFSLLLPKTTIPLADIDIYRRKLGKREEDPRQGNLFSAEQPQIGDRFVSVEFGLSTVFFNRVVNNAAFRDLLTKMGELFLLIIEDFDAVTPVSPSASLILGKFASLGMLRGPYAGKHPTNPNRELSFFVKNSSYEDRRQGTLSPESQTDRDNNSIMDGIGWPRCIEIATLGLSGISTEALEDALFGDISTAFPVLLSRLSKRLRPRSEYLNLVRFMITRYNHNIRDVEATAYLFNLVLNSFSLLDTPYGTPAAVFSVEGELRERLHLNNLRSLPNSYLETHPEYVSQIMRIAQAWVNEQD